MRQVIFFDTDNKEIHCGILTGNGDIICGCCGGIIEREEIGDNYESSGYVILKVFESWKNIDSIIYKDISFNMNKNHNIN